MIAGVDLDDVVHQQQPDHVQDIDLAGVLGQRQREHRQVPAMLGGVFLAAAIDQRRLAHHGFELVQLGEKLELPRERVGGAGGGVRGQMHPPDES